MKYNVYFSRLNSSMYVEEMSFLSSKKRMFFIADKVIGDKPDRVFTLSVEYDDKHSDVYVFDSQSYSCVSHLDNNKFSEFFLFEWESYEEAYRNALSQKETNPLCYNKKEVSL